MHEYGHYIQSQQTGPLYVVPAAASFLGTKWLYYGEAEYVQKGWVPRVSFMWPEVWANRMAKTILACMKRLIGKVFNGNIQ